MEVVSTTDEIGSWNLLVRLGRDDAWRMVQIKEDTAVDGETVKMTLMVTAMMMVLLTAMMDGVAVATRSR